ncbi:MAG: hypothetical protein GY867_02535 [bacterium]|nr:hypothetical protein [bacterium]
MKRILTFIFCAAFLVSGGGSAWAVEKKSKEKPKTETEEKKEPAKKEAPKKPAAKKPSPPKKKPETKKKYDDFVDKNKNGIDDRRENLKKKPTEKKKTD